MQVLEKIINVIKGVGVENYSKEDRSTAVRQALVEVNGGSTKLSRKNFYRGTQLFDLVQELIPTLIDEGFKDTDEIFKLVEYRNIKDGDQIEFVVDGDSLFVVADAALGIQGVRRQRIDDRQTITVNTSFKIVRVYEELSRLLTGKVNFDTFVENVAKSFKQTIMNDAFAALDAISADTFNLGSDYVKSGSFDEAALVELVEHVEAATGMKARIYGTKSALRKITTAEVSEEAKSDKYHLGYYGMFNGTELVQMRQSHKPGTSTFALNNNKLYIIAAGDAPIKVVNEGEGLIIERDPTANNDLTQEYIYGQNVGVGVICSAKMGVWTLA